MITEVEWHKVECEFSILSRCSVILGYNISRKIIYMLSYCNMLALPFRFIESSLLVLLISVGLQFSIVLIFNNLQISF